MHSLSLPLALICLGQGNCYLTDLIRYALQLRPRLAAKRRKLQMCRANSSVVSTEDASNCTQSENWAKVL